MTKRERESDNGHHDTCEARKTCVCGRRAQEMEAFEALERALRRAANSLLLEMPVRAPDIFSECDAALAKAEALEVTL